MLERFIEAVLLSAFFSTVAYGIGRLAGAVTVKMVEKNGDGEELRKAIARRGTIERNLSNRAGELRKAMARLDREIKELTTQRTQLNLAAAEANQTPDRVIRLIGQEVRGAMPYLALVMNKYVSPTGGGKTAVDPAWATAQEVEVWATSIGEALSELAKRYPESQGFKVTNLVSPNAQSGATGNGDDDGPDED
ncbi:MAG: hypothetical protein WCO00_05785 [Rhodospirillaceae bacterium]